jgi:hypothetical protein
VTILAAAGSGVPVYEYTPLQVKQAVAGSGRANYFFLITGHKISRWICEYFNMIINK